MKVALVVWENCSIIDVGPALQSMISAEYAVRTLSMGGNPVSTDCGLTVLADSALERAHPRDFQWLVLPGGAVHEALLENPHLHRFIRQFNGQPGAWVAACGSASVLLAAAGELGGLKFTCPMDVFETYKAYFAHCTFVDDAVCQDGNVITSQNDAGLAFAAAITKRFPSSHMR